MKLKTDFGIEISVTSRLPKDEHKEYYLNYLKRFVKLLNPEKVLRVGFGKTDLRGAYNITFYESNGGARTVKAFLSMRELLSYVVGFVDCAEGCFLKNHLKEVKE